MSPITGHASDLWAVAAKAALIYGTAVLLLRMAERRTLAQWTIIDFATAVAMGAVIARTAVAPDQSYLVGAVAVVTLVALHRCASLLRLTRAGARVLDHGVRVLVVDGRVQSRELRRCGLRDEDLFAHLRQRGTFSLEDLRFVLYEARGDLTIVPADAGARPLVHEAIADAVGTAATEVRERDA
jgi:uncharacterized membrane protein YcaP (DUF421 family)